MEILFKIFEISNVFERVFIIKLFILMMNTAKW